MYSMTRSKRMQPVQQLAQNREQKAVQKLGQSQQYLQAQQAKLEELRAYRDQYASDLSSILDLVDQMNQVDSSGVAPLANPLDATQRLRVDKITESDERDKFQRIAPDVEQGFYRVPKVIE